MVTAAWIVSLVAIRRDIACLKLHGIIAQAMALAIIMIDTQVPHRLFEAVEQWIASKYMFLIMIKILLRGPSSTGY